jgi:dolichol-phosphate mannosyltransferase
VRTFWKFLMVGASGVVVNVGLFALLLAAGVNRYVASPVAIETSIIWNFLLHNSWTFGDRRPRGRARVRGVLFNLASLLVLAVSYGAFVVFSWWWPAWPPVVHQLLAIFPATLLNFALNSYWIFRDAS